MTRNKQDLYAFQVDNARYDVLIKLMLRLYGGMFTDFVPISEVQIAKLLHYETTEVEKMLKHLEKMQVISQGNIHLAKGRCRRFVPER